VLIDLHQVGAFGNECRTLDGLRNVSRVSTRSFTNADLRIGSLPASFNQQMGLEKNKVLAIGFDVIIEAGHAILLHERIRVFTFRQKGESNVRFSSRIRSNPRMAAFTPAGSLS
jgi:hypothetical protein